MMEAALGTEKFANAFTTMEDGSAVSTGNAATTVYAPLWQEAQAYYENRLAEAETNVAAVQETMTAIDAAIAETQTKAAELTATWQATYGAAATEAGAAVSAANSVKTALEGIVGEYNATINIHTNNNPLTGESTLYDADGLGYVPYDNYLTHLHRGEMVLSRQQAEGYRQGSGTSGRQYAVSANLNVGSMTLNNGMDAQHVAQALSRETTRQVRALGRRKG